MGVSPGFGLATPVGIEPMSGGIDTLRLTAEEATGLLERRELTAAELHRAYLDAAAERDPELHCYLRLVEEPVGEGVPIALKDVISTQGIETTAGSKILAGYVPQFDSTVAARCKAAGLPIIGKTNTDEFAMGSSTENSAYGPTRNPWDPERVPGGSGGGSAAAVSAGLAPWALGSDTGGSIKQPSALCGNVGLRPTYGTVSRYGIVAFASSLDQVGPVAKNVRDCALLYSIIAGRDERDSTTVELPEPIRLPEGEDLTGLRIGVPKQLNEAEGIEPGISDAVGKAIELARSLGAEVGECELPRSVEYGMPCYYLIAPAEASSNLARYDGVRYGLRVDGDELPRDGRAHARRRLRRRAETPDHARHVRALGRLLRRLLRPGAEGSDGDRAGARGRVRALRRARLADLADGRLQARREGGEPARDVPLRPAHDPLLHGGPAGPEHPVRALGGPPGGPAADRAAALREHALPSGPRARVGARLRPRSGAAPLTWQPVVGLEIHVQLKTRTKMFCRCPNGFGGGENTQTCPVCLALPGALPVPNRVALEWTLKLGLALGCEIPERAVFARKNYFYPDSPKGYQISQYDLPSCINGKMLVPSVDGDHEIGIVRAHLEEDAAKMIHVGGRTGRIGGAEHSLVDFDRVGTPLVEIVTAPDIHSSAEARRFLQLLRQTIVELGISDAEMEKGTLRVDANVSVRPAGSTELRTRCEIKNMNSFRFVAQGIDAEVARQIAIYEAGGEVVQETYDFDAATATLTARRSKEEADDYRYFPEPDLVPVEPSAELVERLRAELPGAAVGADPPARARARLRAGARARDRRARSALGGDRCRRRRAAARCEPDRKPACGHRRRRRRSERARFARRGARPAPARCARRGARAGLENRASRRRSTSRRKPSRTPPSSSR